jgi:glycosyltransferase involved in cell wall biosynthesis
MKKILFIIPDLHDRVTGANKRAILLAEELSKLHSVIVFSKKKISYINDKKYTLTLDTSLVSILSIFTKNRINYWFCDTIYFAILPLPGLIFTLHDMKEWAKYNRSGFIKKIILYLISKKAKYLITVSENQREIIKKYLYRDSLVFYNAVSKEWLDFPYSVGLGDQKIKDKYVLYVSNFSNHKGHYDILKNRHIFSGYKIIFIGTPIDKGGELIKKNIEKTSGCFVYSDIEEFELIRWVDNASFILFPSHYEGFAMPVLESIILKKKVLINKKLDLNHFKSCKNIKKVSFSDGLNLNDIAWAESSVNYCDKCNCRYGWNDIAEKIDATIL